MSQSQFLSLSKFIFARILRYHDLQDSHDDSASSLPAFYFHSIRVLLALIDEVQEDTRGDDQSLSDASVTLYPLLHHTSLGLSHLVFYAKYLMPLEQQSPTLQYFLNRCVENMQQRDEDEGNDELAQEEANNAKQTWTLLLRCLDGGLNASRSSTTTLSPSLRRLLRHPHDTIQDLMSYHERLDRFIDVQCLLMTHLKKLYRIESKDVNRSSALGTPGTPSVSNAHSIPVTLSRNQIRDLSEATEEGFAGKRRNHIDPTQMSISENAFTPYDPTRDAPEEDDDELVEMGIQDSIVNFPSQWGKRNESDDDFSPRSEGSSPRLGEKSSVHSEDNETSTGSPSNSASHSTSNHLTQSFDRVVRESVAEFEEEFEHDNNDVAASSNLEHSYHPEAYEDDSQVVQDSTLQLDQTAHPAAIYDSSSDSPPNTPPPRNPTPDLKANQEIKFISPRARPTTSTHSQREFWQKHDNTSVTATHDHRRRSHAQFDQLKDEARNARIVPLKKKENLSESEQIREMKKENHMLRMMLLDQQMQSQRDRQQWDSLLKQEHMKARTETMREIGKQKRPSSVQGPRVKSTLQVVDGNVDANVSSNDALSNSQQPLPNRDAPRRRPSTTPSGVRPARGPRSQLSDSSSSHNTSHSSKTNPPLKNSLPSARHKTAGNRTMIENAIRRACFPGKVNEAAKMQALEALDLQETDRYLISLARENSTTCRGIYALDLNEEEPYAVLIFGKGPKKFTNKSVKSFFRYNSTSKSFIPQASKTHTLSDLRVDAVLLVRKPVVRGKVA